MGAPSLRFKTTFALVLAAIPLVIVGVYIPQPLGDLLRTAARAMGG